MSAEDGMVGFYIFGAVIILFFGTLTTCAFISDYKMTKSCDALQGTRAYVMEKHWCITDDFTYASTSEGWTKWTLPVSVRGN